MSHSHDCGTFQNGSNKWNKIKEIFHVKSKWLSLFCEEWKTDEGELLEYWRIEKADSLIVIPQFDNQFVLPQPIFRPGVNKATLDFPGGRLEGNSDPKTLIERARNILCDELRITDNQIKDIKLIDRTGKIINSSFNSQKLFIVSTKLQNLSLITKKRLIFFKQEDSGILLEELECMQCSYALMYYLMNKY